MGYREKVVLYFKDGREVEYNNVYIKALPGGFQISQDSDYENSEFIPYNDIDKSACRKANPDSGGCYLSTAVFNDKYSTFKLDSLRGFRDEVMVNSKYSNWMVDNYYLIGPYIGEYLDKTVSLKKIIRYLFIEPCTKFVIRRRSVSNSFVKTLYDIIIYGFYINGFIIAWFSYLLKEKNE